jgi:putative serine protease PepD
MTDMNPPAEQPAADQPYPAGTSQYDTGPYAAPPPPPEPPPAPSIPEYATQPIPPALQSPQVQPWSEAQPGQPWQQTMVVDAPAKPRTGRTLALVVAAALIAGALGGGIGAAVESNHDSSTTALPASLTNSATSNPAKVNLPAGSIESVAAKVLPSVVSIIERSTDGSGGEGSGIVLSADGEILTNNHVVADSENGGTLRVTTQDGKTVDATILGTDPTSDLAVIKATGVTGLIPATLGSSSTLVVGQTVVAVGSPLGLSGTVTTGIVSALNRPVSTSDSTSQSSTSGAVLNAIQTDAAINPGNSGGPLVDLNGQVVGINSAIASLGSSFGSSQSGSIGLGFSIPIDQAKRIADELISTGKATHPQLGVSLTDGQDGGAVLAQVTAGGAADKAGLKVGDIVTAVNGHFVDSSESLVADIRSSAPGETVSITYTRGGQSHTVSVTLGQASS